MIEEYFKVKTLVDKDKFKAGTIGVVVSVYPTGTACEVEVWNENNYPVDVITYKTDEIETIE